MRNGTKGIYDVAHLVWNHFCCVATVFSPQWNTQLRFLRRTGHFANLKEPKTFSEKLSWLKLYRNATDPLVKQCADKYAVREYVKSCGLARILNPLFAVYRSEKEIVWKDLPTSFVLKWNFGCGFNILCPDKYGCNEREAKKKLHKFRKTPFWLEHAEYQYKVDKKYLLCERYMASPLGEDLLDYKVYCFHGRALAILVIRRAPNKEKAAIFMDSNWNVLSDVPDRYSESLVPEKPVCLQEILEAAERLAAPFPFVRVDFYQYQGKAVFGEMTFTPAAGICPSETKINGKSMGEYIDLEMVSNENSKPRKGQ